MKIITLTLNPAFDTHYTVKGFVPFTENYADYVSTQPGGKGVNIAKALRTYGKECENIIVLGNENAEKFEQIMLIPYTPIYADGKIRENITIHSDINPETKISLDNFFLNDEQLAQIGEKIYSSCDDNAIVTLTGRLPKGLSTDAVFEFCKNIKDKGAKLVIDSNSFSLDMLTKVGPWLIKPNEEEIGKFFRECHTLAEAQEIAKIIHNEGIDNVLISMGKQGIAYAGKNKCFSVISPKINVVSTIGAGDSSVSGFIYAYSQGLSPEECVKHAVAFGSAACLTEGTLPPLKEDIDNLLKNIRFED